MRKKQYEEALFRCGCEAAWMDKRGMITAGS